MKRARILLADDHTMVVAGLKSLLEPDFDVVGTVEDGRAMLQAAEDLRPDVIVADISMPLLNGIEAARQLKRQGTRTKIVFMTMHPDMTYATKAFDAGASGYVLKHSAPSELVTAIREVLQGRTYVTPRIAGTLMDTYREGTRPSDAPAAKLTPRQREVLQLVAEGHAAKEIARILNISPRTAEFHKYRIMEVLDLHTNADLTRYAIQHGIVSH
jgi:DNA-binding NarL/FixJ family response regulator